MTTIPFLVSYTYIRTLSRLYPFLVSKSPVPAACPKPNAVRRARLKTSPVHRLSVGLLLLQDCGQRDSLCGTLVLDAKTADLGTFRQTLGKLRYAAGECALIRVARGRKSTGGCVGALPIEPGRGSIDSHVDPDAVTTVALAPVGRPPAAY